MKIGCLGYNNKYFIVWLLLDYKLFSRITPPNSQFHIIIDDAVSTIFLSNLGVLVVFMVVKAVFIVTSVF